VGKDLAAQTAGSRKGVWHNSRSPVLSFALPGKVLAELGVPLLLEPPANEGYPYPDSRVLMGSFDTS